MSDNTNSLVTVSRANIAVNRFGYGARGHELEAASKSPKEWIKSQLLPITFSTTLPNSNDIFLEHAQFVKDKKQQKKSKQPAKKTVKNSARNNLRLMSIETLEQAINSPHSISWRLLDFFSNHFSVSANGRLMTGLAATLEREAIAPNLFGRFEDMLLAVEQHPAMMIYLNNEKSFGPNSRQAKKRKVGLNENLAREILELHTLGVNGGYQQEDVLELAKAITGWSVKNPKKERSTGFIFRAHGHEPGNRKLLGNHYKQQGISQGEQMLRDLANHPNTAKYVCYKLAHHFVSDHPPKPLTDTMESTWLKTQGNIKSVMVSLLNADEAWLAQPQKFKTPREFVISTFRALAPAKMKNKALINAFANLGQRPFSAGSPAGFSDNESDWLGASALMARVDWSANISAYQKRVNAEKLMTIALGSSVSPHTYQTVMRAESRQQALALLLMSPEFQRR
ncbi:MAG: DUF1800 domain-containing protein [Colwellia sp.]|nr:DUF1800 domain-containing protein [Colwellia sp.]MCW8866353.1 DUF1800 domain-containing protein [Colwellia sp.]MCW9080291.1 DUF1800 domain-containing protein [Colwellia sp.]